LPNDQQVNVTGRVCFPLGKGTENPSRRNPSDWLERPLERRLNSHRTLEECENRLQVWVGTIDAVVELTTFRFRVQKPFASESRQFAGEVGRINVKRNSQLAHINPRCPVHQKEGQHLASQLGSERNHCSNNILQMQYIITALISVSPPVTQMAGRSFISPAQAENLADTAWISDSTSNPHPTHNRALRCWRNFASEGMKTIFIPGRQLGRVKP